MPQLVQVDGIGSVEFGDEFSPDEIAAQVSKLYEQQDTVRALARYRKPGGESAIVEDFAKAEQPQAQAPKPWWKNLPQLLAPPTELEGAFDEGGNMASPAEGMAAGGKFLGAATADAALAAVGYPGTENLRAVGTDPLGQPLPAEIELAELETVQGAAAKGALSVPRAIPGLAMGTLLAPVVSPYVSYPLAFGGQTYGETQDPAAAGKSAAVAALFPLVGRAMEPVVASVGQQLIGRGLIANETALKAVEATIKQAAFQTAAQITTLPEYIEATPDERIRLLAETTAANMVFAIPDALNIPRASVPSDTARRIAQLTATAYQQSLRQAMPPAATPVPAQPPPLPVAQPPPLPVAQPPPLPRVEPPPLPQPAVDTPAPRVEPTPPVYEQPRQPGASPPGVDVREPTDVGPTAPAEREAPPAPRPEAPASPPAGGPAEGAGNRGGGGVPSGGGERPRPSGPRKGRETGAAPAEGAATGVSQPGGVAPSPAPGENKWHVRDKDASPTIQFYHFKTRPEAEAAQRELQAQEDARQKPPGGRVIEWVIEPISKEEGVAQPQPEQPAPILSTQAGQPAAEQPSQAGKATDANHVLPADADWIPSGDKSKVRANLDAIKLLRQLEAENRNATPEEKAVLARYTGWGGLKPIFDEGKAYYRKRAPYTDEQKRESANWEKDWGKLYDETKATLTEEEHGNAARSILNAHYTSRDIINAMWGAVQRLGFKGGKVLEPAAGAGNFIGLTPEGLRGKVRWNAVELDSMSARLAQKLYPEARVQATGFEKARLAPNSQDLVISNVPFAASGPNDKRYPEMSLHNYFFARALDVVKPGGIVAAITSDSTMDGAASRKAREFFAERADLVGAIRLPNTAFKKNAGTEVTTDILFFRKRDATPFKGEPFLRVVPTKTYKGEPIDVNEYFVAHPEMLLGRLSKEGTMYRADQPALLPTPGADLNVQLAEAIGRLPENVMGGEAPAAVMEAPVAAKEAKVGQLTIKDGVAYQVQADGTLAPTDWGTDAKKVKQAVAYMGTVEATKANVAKMLDPNATEADIAAERAKLNKLYDAYRKQYGAINERRSQFLDDDVDFPLALALEDSVTRLTEQGGKAKRVTEWLKARIFGERTIFPRTAPERVDTVQDALQVSQNFRGGVDILYIASLTGRKMEQVVAELESSGMAFENPANGQWESRSTYLSGFVKDKLKAARFAAEEDPRFARHVAELEKVQPPPIAIENIGVKLGSVFVPPKVIEAFLRDRLQVTARVNFTPETGDWSVAPSAGQFSERNKTTYGIHEWKGHELLEQSLNLKSAIVTDLVPKEGGGTSEVKNQNKSLEAQQRQDMLQRDFRQYLLSSPEFVREVETIYNDRYNGVVAPKFDPPTWAHYPGASTDIKLRDHQKAVVTRMLQNSTLLAHAVGTGKTYAMSTAAMEMRRLGLARKPMIVVQNATLEQFARSFKRLYPGARILAPNAKQRDAKNRNKTMSRIATGDWDAVIVPQSFVNMLPDNPVRETGYIQKRLDELEAAKLEAASTEGKRSPKASDLQRAIDRLEKRLDALKDRKKDDVLTFEQLGVDALFVDEAHAYKKLEFSTKMDSIKGLDTGASQRGWSMSMKTRWVQEQNQGRNVVFATGTPVSNTIAEAWNMMRYVRPDVLKAYNIEKFDDFASTFGDTVTQLEMTPGGSWKPVTRFARYTNGPELISAWRTVADVVTPEEVNLPGLPALKNGRPTVHTIKQSPQLKGYVKFLREELERFAAMTGREKRENSHIPLVVFGLAKKASLDMRMIDPSLPDQPGSKLNVAADIIAQTFHDSTSVKGAQMVFSDAFQDNPDKPRFNLYEEMKKKLIERGVPENQIAIITADIKDARREALFTKVNDGDLRVVIGSTERMGVGVNAQEHLIALHHLDAPPRPMDIEQRNGRILRQGNQNTEVEVHSYGVENTLDAAMFQKLATKQKFINQILRGDLQGRNFEDAANEQSLTFEEQMAAFSGDKRAMEKVALENQVRQLEALRSGHFEQQRKSRDSIENLRTRALPWQETQLEKARAEAARFNEVFGRDTDYTLDTGKRTVTGRKEVVSALDEVFKAGREATLEAVRKGSFGDSAVDLGTVTLNGQPVKLTGLATADAKGVVNPDTIVVGWQFNGGTGGRSTSGAGFFMSLAAALERIQSEPERALRSLEGERRNLRELEGFVQQPFEREAELNEARAKLAQLTGELEAEGKTPPPSGQGEAGKTSPGANVSEDFGEGEVEHGFSGNVSLRKAAAADVARIRNLVAPQTAGDTSRFAGNLLRELNAKQANELARADEALRKFRRDFDRTPINLRKFKYDPTLPLPRNLAFIDAYESGNVSHLSRLDQDAASEFHRLNQKDLARVQALGTGALTTFYQNYFPHIWDDPVAASAVVAKWLARAPLEGPKAFLKKRTHQLFVDGLAAGLKPVHDNPVDLWLLKKREIERYILAHDFVREMKSAGLMKFKYAFAKAPEGWTTVNDRAFTVYGPPTVTIKEAFDAGMREATLDLLQKLGVPHERLARIGGRRWGYEREMPGSPGTESITTKFGGPDFVIWHELGHVLHNRYNDLQPLLTANDQMNTELRALADARIDNTSPKGFARYVRTMPEKMAVALQAYVHAPELMTKLAPTVKTALEGFIAKHPELAPVNDIRPGLRLGVGEAEITHGGLLKLGDWMMPDKAAGVVNNFLSPGLNSQLWYRTLRETGNLLNSVQLGLSAFHLGFTSLDAATSRLALGLEDAARGNFGDALKSVASVPVSPLTNLITGAKLRKEVLRPGSYPQMAAIAKALEKAGGRVGQDAFWQTEFTRRMKRAVHQGGLQWATLPLRAPLAAWEQLMRPILEYIVPRQKLGVFADMAQRELVNLSPTATEADVREAMRKAWDSVDNRMGQVVYDNLFYNRTVKDVALLAFRAYGWQLGKYREGFGAVADTLRAAGKVAKGERPEFSHRMAYAMALPMMVGTLGAVMQYLLTQEAPQSAMDYFQPRTGEVDRNGNPVRLNLPSYVKDVISYTKHPLTSVGHSLHPLLVGMFDLLMNRDFYDTQIRNPEDPPLKQGSDVAVFAGKQFIPFAVAGAQKLSDEQAPAWKQVLPFVGITPVPSRLTMSPSQELAAEITADRMPSGARTKEKFDAAKVRGEVVELLRRGQREEGKAKLRDALDANQLTAAQLDVMMNKLKWSPYQFQVNMMASEDAMRVWRIASPEERDSIRFLVLNKIARSKTLSMPEKVAFGREVVGSGRN